MRIKIISKDFSSLSLLNHEGKLFGLARKWAFTPNPPSRFKIRSVQNYLFQLSNYLTPTHIQYLKELDGIEDCSFFKSMIIGGRYGKDHVKEVYLFSYPDVSELGKLNVRYNSPNYGEKNFSFFTYNDKTFILYSINPLVVLQLNSLEAIPIQIDSIIPQIPEVHGGTSLIPYNKIELLGICHSYTSINNSREYTIYAYTLLNYQPFKILRFSSPLITYADIPEGLECPSDCWWMNPKTSKVVFERGLVEDDKERILIGFGMQDSAIAIATITKNELEKKLKLIL